MLALKKTFISFKSLDAAENIGFKGERRFSIYKDEQGNYYIHHENEPLPPGQWLIDYIYYNELGWMPFVTKGVIDN